MKLPIRYLLDRLANGKFTGMDILFQEAETFHGFNLLMQELFKSGSFFAGSCELVWDVRHLIPCRAHL